MDITEEKCTPVSDGAGVGGELKKRHPRRREAKSKLRRRLAAEMIRGECDTEEILSELGIAEEEYEAFIAQDEFRQLIAEAARARAEAEAPQIWRSLVRMAKGGNVPAIRLYLDLSGARHTAARVEPEGEIESLRRDIFGDG